MANLSIDVGNANCDIQGIEALTEDVNVTISSANISDCNRNRIWVKNIGTQNVVVLPSVGAINGFPNYPLTPNQSALFYFDGTNWIVLANKN